MLDELLIKVKKASYSLQGLSANERRKCLELIKNALLENKDEIIKENNKDIALAKKSGMSDAMIDRLTLSKERIDGLARSIENVISLDEVVYQKIEENIRPNGLKIVKESVPFGVIGIIYEARPNVSVDIACLCLKTANACLLKGGKEALYTNIALVHIMQEAIKEIVDPNCISLVEGTSREVTNLLLTKKEYIDLLIPRGSKGLIQYVINNSRIPYIETGAGNCHLYVHEKADLNKALEIAINAKYQRPSVCNAIESIVVDKKIKDEFLPYLYQEFSKLKIEMRGDDQTLKVIPVCKATEEDFYQEYNDYIVSIKVVEDINEAIPFINKHSTKHSEAIISEDSKAIELFLNSIDSACVYANASTRFSDGGEFGLGAEIGISTQKLHARGPMGLKAIVTYKYKIYGEGQVRK